MSDVLTLYVSYRYNNIKNYISELTGTIITNKEYDVERELIWCFGKEEALKIISKRIL